MTESVAELNHIKHAPKVEGVLPLFHTRWSPRAFAERDVSAADLTRVFEAARWAASASNEQPWRFLVGTRGSEAYQKIFDTLVPFNQLWAASAPVLILDVAKTKLSRNDAPNRAALYDLGAAAAYLTLQASALGLATHQMGGFDADAAREAFGIPGDYIIGAVIALGYQGEPETLPNEQFRSQETAPRTRKALKEIVFSAWERPADIA
jgi:nitroreductase